MTRIVSRIILHPDYISDSHQNDLAILELEKPVEFSRAVRPICLPRREPANMQGVEGIVVGFGYVNTQEDFPEQLMQAAVRIMSNQDCKQKFEDRHLQRLSDKIFQTSLCAGGSGKEGSCPGKVYVCVPSPILANFIKSNVRT